MERMLKAREQVETALISLTMFISIIGQIEPIRELFRPIMFALWGVSLLFIVIANFNLIRIHRFSLFYLSSYGLYILFCFIISLFNKDYLETNFMTVLLPPLIVTLVSECYKPIASHYSIKIISLFFVMASLIYAVWVHLTFFPSLVNWYSLNTYAFVSKNSAAQIWGSSILLLFFFIEGKSKIFKWVYIFLSLYLLFLCFLSQCRTAILGISCVFIWYFFKRKSSNISNKIFFYISIILIALLIAIKWDAFSEFMDKALFLGAQDSLDANQMSSGRIELYDIALSNILDSPLIGVGKYYVDNHYLCVLSESGLVGFLLIEPVLITRLLINFKYTGDYKYKIFLTAISIFYIVESFFEAFPPFGPGVTAMAFWFYSQILNKE